jgi:hypothetical protein
MIPASGIAPGVVKRPSKNLKEEEEVLNKQQ